jgi:hypothetical protein
MVYSRPSAAVAVTLLIIFLCIDIFYPLDSFTGQVFVMIIFIVLQALAIGWYILSYIPYGRTMISAICCKGGSSAGSFGMGV